MKNKTIRNGAVRKAVVGTVLALSLSTQMVMAAQTTDSTGTQTTYTETAEETSISENIAALTFTESNYYVSTNTEVDITVNVSCSTMPDEYTIVLEYDDARMEYISGADDCAKGKIIFSGKADQQTMSFTVKFKTLCNGNGGIYVRNAYILAADGSGEMKVSEKPSAVIAIVGSESTDQPDFAVDPVTFDIDTEIPLVGKVVGKDGTASYIVDLSCFKPDSVDFNYTLTGDIYGDVLVTTLCSEDKSVQLAYLLKEDKSFQLCAYNNGKFYPVTEQGGNYYISPYGISEWPEGMTEKNVEQEGVIYILNAKGKGVFVKYLKGEIVNWDYKSEVEPEETEEKEHFYNFKDENGKVTLASIWKGITSHIEISLLIFIAFGIFLRWIIGLSCKMKRKKKAKGYKETLPPEIPYDELMAEKERVVREAEFEAIRKENEARAAVQAAVAAKSIECTILPENSEDQIPAPTTEENNAAPAAEQSVHESFENESFANESPAKKNSAGENPAQDAEKTAVAEKAAAAEKATAVKKKAGAEKAAASGKVEVADKASAADKAAVAGKAAASGKVEVADKAAAVDKPVTLKKKKAEKASENLQTEEKVRKVSSNKKKSEKTAIPKRTSDEMGRIVENGLKKAKAAKAPSKKNVSVDSAPEVKEKSSKTQEDELIVDLAEIKKRKFASKQAEKTAEKPLKNKKTVKDGKVAAKKSLKTDVEKVLAAEAAKGLEAIEAVKAAEETEVVRTAAGAAGAAEVVKAAESDVPAGFEELRYAVKDSRPQTNEDFASELQAAFDELKEELDQEESEQKEQNQEA